MCLLTACGKDAASQRDGGDRPVPVTTQQLRLQPWNDSLQALGTVRAHESITVTAKVSEIVQQVHFDSGDVVAKGAALVTLSGQAQQAALVEAQAAANEAEKLLGRQNELADRQLIARSALDTQRATRDAAHARVAQIRAQLGDRVISAPFAGVLGIRKVSPGSLVTPGTAIATLDDVRRVYVDFPVPESLLAQIAPGLKVAGRSQAYADRRFEGVVSTIDARVDEATRALTVRADFDNADRALRPGMLLTIDLQQPERQTLVVPEIAVVQVGTDSFVYRVGADGRVERAVVEIGGRRDGRAEIIEGVKAGDRIVVDGTGKLRPGSQVVEATQGDDGSSDKGDGKT
ncbi:MAG TPA: efflux RND transporter periplasmic adaptor subunit [Lysobacter sp.]|nr:efflux RND transporter periplasmic adaptor subunit [Lysobacter sp.]